jgi:hypothetical protein
MRKIIFTIAIVTALAIPTTTQAKSYGDELVMPWRWYKRLAQCETDSRWHTSTRNYTSGYGIAIGTWRRYSNSSNADRYTPLEQARIVDRIAFLGFTRDTGEYVWPVGPYGWAVIKSQNCMNLQQFICRSTHPKVKRWKRYC